jgi:transposase InsO family protein
MLDNSNLDSGGSDRLAEAPAPAPEHPTLDHLMADNLKPDDIAVIDGEIHQFIHKEPGPGPHVFLNTDQRKTAFFGTGQLLSKMTDGSYIRPGGGTVPSIEDLAKLDDVERQRLRAVLGAIRAKPRKAAQIRWLYVGHFMSKIWSSRAEGVLFTKNIENAALVVAEVDGLLEAHNRQQADPKNFLTPPRCRMPRTVLKWVENEKTYGLQEISQVHGNALKEREHKLPKFVFECIATTIRELVALSGKITPQAVFRIVRGRITEHNELHQTAFPLPGKTTVYEEFCRYDPWIRLAKRYDVKKADLEYGAVGKLQRPTRILDLCEIDHHKFDVHAVLGEVEWGETALPRILSRVGIDRFWICAMIDVCSGYPVGWQLSFEPGGLLPALACVDHAVRMKPYVAERWPDIVGAALGYGKPVRLRYDNAKEFVGLQMAASLARIGVGFENSISKIPNSKPYIERFFGSMERDFIQYLKGATGHNVQNKGSRDPLQDARITFDDFEKLLHQYFIECYARRPQDDLGQRSPEQTWMRDAASPTTRPRTLTKSEEARLDVIACIEIEVAATREGIRWKHLHYQSHELQELRRKCGAGYREQRSVKFVARIPLKNIGKMYVADPNVDRTDTAPMIEIEVPCTNPHAVGLTHWQHKVVLAEMSRLAQDPSNTADYEAAYLRLFRASMKAMGVPAFGEKAPKKARMTGGQAPRFTGIFLAGPQKHALHNVKKVLDRYDILGDIARAMEKANVASESGAPADDVETELYSLYSTDAINEDEQDGPSGDSRENPGSPIPPDDGLTDVDGTPGG